MHELINRQETKETNELMMLLSKMTAEEKRDIATFIKGMNFMKKHKIHSEMRSSA